MKRIWLILWSWLWFSALSAQQVWYVTPAGGGAQDGSSWGDAFSFIQDALDQAQAGDSVWVAAGIYKPTMGTDPGVYLELPSGVVFMGGFAGWESSPEQRDLALNTTIISGQLSSGQKSYLLMRVLNPAPGTRIDGVVFEDTKREPSTPQQPGAEPLLDCIGIEGWYLFCASGGLWVEVSDSISATGITVSECTFRRHNQDFGGGLTVHSIGHPDVFVENCIFEQVYFSYPGPGAIANASGVNLTGRMGRVDITDCLFKDNSSLKGAGLSTSDLHFSIYPFELNRVKSLRVVNSIFHDNICTDFGGGLFAVKIEDTLLIDQCHFYNNSSVYYYNGTGNGGGAYIHAFPSGQIHVIGSYFTHNKAHSLGGALVVSGSLISEPPYILNCVFVENESEGQGGAIYRHNNGFYISFCSLYRNKTFGVGGAVRGYAGDTIITPSKLVNSIFYQNESMSTNFDVFYSTNATVENNLFDQDSTVVTSIFPLSSNLEWNSNLYGNDPLFLDAPNGDFRLSCHSPAVDAGDLSSVLDLGLQFDIDGLPRVQNGLPDMGAHEWQSLAANLEQQDASCHEYSDGIIQVQVNDGTPPYEYTWNTGDNTPTISELSAGEYTLTVTDSEGCESIYQLEIMEPDPLWLQVQVGADSSETNTGWLWVDSISGGTAPYSLQWSTGSTEFYLEGLPGGTYGLSLVDAQGCTLDTVLQVDVILSTDLLRSPQPLDLFPNPASHHVTLHLPTAAPEGMQVRIADMYGREMSLPNQPQIGTGTRQHTLDISHLPAGVYWVSVHRNGGEVYGGKLVVQ